MATGKSFQSLKPKRKCKRRKRRNPSKNQRMNPKKTMLKFCSRCQQYLSMDFFGRNQASKDGLAFYCKNCAKQYKKDYFFKNKSQINQLRRKNYSLSSSKIKEQNQKSYLQHLAARKAAMKVYYQNHLLSFKSRSKSYRQSHHQEILLRNRQRQLKLAINKISQDEINHLLLTYYHRCFYCHQKVIRGINLHLDHRVPLKRGGKHHISNLVPSCQTCNLQKGILTDVEFMNKGIMNVS